jgi:16S rRNA (uracil1498-N3)-methyltransferase
MHLFYAPEIIGNRHVLDEQESRHAIRVLRLSAGDRVCIVDGAGGWYEAVIAEENPGKCLLEVISFTAGYQPLPYHLHIAISPTKSMDRFEWFLEKATEVGISVVTPLICRRTERNRVNRERLEKIVIAAMKQSLKAYKPLLSEPLTVHEFLEREHKGFRGIAHCMPEGRRTLADLDRTDSYTLLVGPEGDFTEEEVKEAVGAGYVPVHLGSSRLRTETAGIHICSTIQVIESRSLGSSAELAGSVPRNSASG